MSNVLVTGTIAGLTLNAGDYLQIFPGALITINSAYGAAVRGIGGPATITNAGSILASGFRSAGVRLDAGGTIANSGTIKSTGNVGYGIRLSTGGTVINGASGSIGVFANFSRGIQADSGTTTVVNDGTISGVIGAYLHDGGTVTNGAPGDTTALIQGIDGVFVRYGGVTLTNYGTISATSLAVYSGAGGSVTNGASGSTQAVMTGEVWLQRAPGTVVNYGTISAGGPGDSGILLTSGGSVTNAAGALIEGVWAGVSFRFGNSTLNNDGTIMSSSGSGVRLYGGASVTNHGLIEGQTGIAFASGGQLAGASGTIDNFGTIVGDAGIAVAFSDSAQTLKLEAGSALSGAIAGFQGADTIDLVDVQATGLSFSGGTLSVMNGAATVASLGFTSAYVSSDFALTSDGHGGTNIGLTQPSGNNVSGSYDHTVVLSNPATQNPTTIAAGSSIVAGNGVGVLGLAPTAWTLTNLGTIVSPGTNVYGQRMDGVVLQSGGLLTNGASGLIDAGKHGVYIGGVPGTVANSGTIEGQYSGVYLKSGGSVSNAAGGLIEGYRGIEARGNTTVTNAGTITGDRSVYLYDGGTVTNQSGAQISDGRGGIYFLFGGGTVTNLGTISAGASYGRAIFLLEGGDVTNGAVGATDALIASGANGIVAYYNRSTVTNYGTISATRQAVSLHAGGVVINGPNGDGAALIEDSTVAVSITGGDGTVANGGTITGAAGVLIAGGNGSVSNSGTMTATEGAGVLLGSGGNVLNSGLITGTGNSVVTYNFVYGWFTGISASGAAGAGVVINGAGALVNSGTVLATGHTTKYAQNYNFGSYTSLISDGPSGVGAALLTGSVTNTADGLLEGNDRGVSIGGADGSVTNAGTIAGGVEGVVLGNGGDVANNGSGALIAGGNDGVKIQGGAGTVVTSGTITGDTGYGVYLAAGGSVTNIGAAALISGAEGVNVQFGGTVTNNGTITGAQGVSVAGGAGSVSNDGSIIASLGKGVQLGAGGNVLNSGLITGSGTAHIFKHYHYGSLYGYGVLGASGAGVVLNDFGTVDNSGTILANGYESIFTSQYNGITYDFTTSFGASGVGTNLTAGGSVTNAAGGLIEANAIGVGITGGVGTVVNAGTITGGAAGTAVALDSNFGGLLVADAGAVFVGLVSGGNAALSTLELASGPGTGTLSGLGTQFVDFGSIVVDAGAAWTLTGNNTLASTVTLTNAGSLSFTGTFDDAGALIGTGGMAIAFAGSGSVLRIEQGAVLQGTIGGFVTGETIDLAGISATGATLGAGNVLTVQESGGGTLTLNLATNQNYAGYGFTVSSDGGGGSDITVAVLDPGPTAHSGATTLGHNQTIDLTGLIQGLVTPGLPGDTETITAVTAPSGSVNLAGGVVSYTTPPSGPVTLSYTVKDQYNNSATGSLVVTVDTGPTTIAGTTTVGHGMTVDLTAAIAALVHPGIATDSETVKTISASHGVAGVSATGVVTYTAPSSGVDTLGYTVVDQYGDSAAGTLSVTVDPGPTAGAAAITLLAGQSTDLTAYLLGLDTPGIAGDTLTLSGDNTAGTHGTVSLTGGVLSYLAPSTTGTDSFGYTVSDQYGDTASAIVSVTIASSSNIGNSSGTVVLGNNSGPATFGNGSVTVVGGNGNDQVSGGNGTNSVTLGNGNDTVVLGQGANNVTLGTGNDSVTLGNNTNTVTVTGSATSVDTIVVGNGNNTLNLGAGTYNVTEGNGADTIILGNGKYNVTAGHGSPDLFIYTTPSALLTMSFASNDELVFRDSGFDLGVNEGHGTASLQAIAASLLSPNSDGTFATAGNRFAYDQPHGNLYYDADGTGSGSGSTLIAHLTNDPHLTAASLFFTS